MKQKSNKKSSQKMVSSAINKGRKDEAITLIALVITIIRFMIYL